MAVLSAARCAVSRSARHIFLLVALVAAAAAPAVAQVPCTAENAEQLDAALARIAASRDPCGQSDQVRAVLDTLRHCPRTYRVCIDPEISRNMFDRPTDDRAESARTISWNPTLRTALENSCDGDGGEPVRRDPTASLLHELVHAAHDCLGWDPGAHELDAVRVENIYRRAAGLCQRTRYGDALLPADSLIACAPGHCTCVAQPPAAPDGAAAALQQAAASRSGGHAADQRDTSGTASRD